ncbi:MAG: UDP-N-acetylglucosamine 2-epimerase (hydrolyzing) [Sandaracinaceae bacterium]|nr:UDP-N-acetylglucosamine 2-epimerase (hydrolyzing) [Sandaracinaceae bacterium]
MTSRRKVCVVLVDRANYGRLKPVMQAIRERPSLELQVLAAGTMVLERFDYPVRVVRDDGFDVHGEIYTELEGSTPTTMAKSIGFGVSEFSSEFSRLKPDVVLIIGDRYEALSAALAAAYMNLTIVHLQGGEVSGSIDESARHVITKLAHYHFPATERSKDFILRMGEMPSTVLGVGCPSSDLARTIDRSVPSDALNARGSGALIDPNKPYLLVLFHPTTTEYGGERAQMEAVLGALDEVKHQTLLLWPNIDAGADHISKAIRVFREAKKPSWLRAVTNLAPDVYLRVLANAACAVGNSSSFVRDAGYFGTPIVLIGNRQNFRETDLHVTRVPPDQANVSKALKAQLGHGRYAPSTLYGDGHVAEKVAKGLESLTPYTQKHLSYVQEAPKGS